LEISKNFICFLPLSHTIHYNIWSFEPNYSPASFYWGIPRRSSRSE